LTFGLLFLDFLYRISCHDMTLAEKTGAWAGGAVAATDQMKAT
jgi:hypothetical protein